MNAITKLQRLTEDGIYFIIRNKPDGVSAMIVDALGFQQHSKNYFKNIPQAIEWVWVQASQMYPKLKCFKGVKG